MKPASFSYHAPSSVSEVLRLLARWQDAELMAGNQSLGLDMATREKRPDHLIDLGGVDELSFVTVTDERAEIGATTTHRTIERSEPLAHAVPMIPESAKIAGPTVRNRGTMGGGVAEADPAGNYPAALLALDGTVNLRSTEASRSVPASEFFVSYMSTDMREDELIQSVTIDRGPYPVERTGMAYIELKQSALAWADVSAAAVVRVAGTDSPAPDIEHARLALANVADVPPVVDGVSGEVEGGPLTESAATAVEHAAAAVADPNGRIHADEEFKPEIAGTYGRRAIELAYERAASGQHSDAAS